MEGPVGSGEERGSWFSRATMALRSAEEMVSAGLYRDAVAACFTAMLHAAREMVASGDVAAGDWEELMRLFGQVAVRAGLSNESRRALPIVAELYRRVVVKEEEEADPLTASACLEDARAFVREVGEKTGLA